MMSTARLLASLSSVALLALCAAPAVAQDTPPTGASPPAASPAPAAPAGVTPVSVGVYVRRIDGLDLKAGTADLTFYLWMRWQGDIDGAAFEVRNGKLESKDNEYRETKDGWTYYYCRCQATVLLHIDFRAYPFDEHRLSIELEHPDLEASALVYVPDTPALQRLKPPTTSGWIVSPAVQQVTTTSYDSNWGQIGVDSSKSTTFSVFQSTVVLRHEAGATITKTFLPVFIAMLITFLAFLIHPEELEARVGVGVAGIFGAATSLAVISQGLPEISYMTLADKVHTASLLYIFMTLLTTAYAGHFARLEQVEKAKKFDHIAGGIMMATYTILVGTLILHH